jgi:type VI secretion system protein VasD
VSDIGVAGPARLTWRAACVSRRAQAPAVGLAAVLCMAMFVAACGGAPKPTQLGGTIEASAQVNPSISKRPSPVLVRVYELKSATAFNGADFVSLFQRDQTELAADLVGREEFMLTPGQSRPYAKTVAPEVRYIGVLAAFRDVERAQWRSVVAIQPGKKQNIVIRVSELSVTVALAP